MALQLRSPDDVKRLFSALGDVPTPDMGLTVSDVDTLALYGGTESSLDAIDPNSFLLSILVALTTGWVAIRGYERNRSMAWGLTWAAFGYLLPLPAIAASYYQDTVRG
jgi:hypothetical protein